MFWSNSFVFWCPTGNTSPGRMIRAKKFLKKLLITTDHTFHASHHHQHKTFSVFTRDCSALVLTVLTTPRCKRHRRRRNFCWYPMATRAMFICAPVPSRVPWRLITWQKSGREGIPYRGFFCVRASFSQTDNRDAGALHRKHAMFDVFPFIFHRRFSKAKHSLALLSGGRFFELFVFQAPNALNCEASVKSRYTFPNFRTNYAASYVNFWRESPFYYASDHTEVTFTIGCGHTTWIRSEVENESENK